MGRRGFTVPASRGTTWPVTVITLSGRTASAAAKAGEPAGNTHWVIAVVVAQVDEQQAAVVALGVHPAREAGRLPGVGGAQCAAGMGAIGVHRGIPAGARGGDNRRPPGVSSEVRQSDRNHSLCHRRRLDCRLNQCGGAMPKNLIFCADGTWNGPGGDDMTDKATNVFRLFVNLDGEDDPGSTLLADEQERNLQRDGAIAQSAKYLHGVGDSRNPLVRLLGGTVGAGLIARIVRGYTYLSRNYRPGDRIFIVGFSRGAYTARALAGMIVARGLLDATQTIWRTRRPRIGSACRSGTPIARQHRGRTPTCSAGCRRCCRVCPSCSVQHDEAKLVDTEIEAVAVWDTVGSLGIPEFTLQRERVDAFQFADTRLSGKVHHGLHAVAVDEQRADFTPTLWDPDARIVQVLFPGAHSDVGGGYATDEFQSGLSDCSLAWMTGELTKLGLLFARSPKYVPNPRESSPLHQPWRDPPWNILPSRARNFPKGLRLSRCLVARCGAALDPLYAPRNVADYLEGGQVAAGIEVV